MPELSYTHETYLSPFTWRYGSEAMRRAFTDRNRYLGDPAFVRRAIEARLHSEVAA